MKPNYMVIGSAKCASTSLCTLLGQHPDVFVTEVKEPNFFSNEEVYSKGFEWYESLYAGAGSASARGEGSQRYTFGKVYPQTAKRIFDYAPETKLIYIVRHPLRKIEGNWVQMRAFGPDAEVQAFHSFDKSVREQRDWITDSANYLAEIELYREHFPDEQILVLFFEDFVSEPESVMRRCFEFLGVDPDAEVDRESSHQNPSTGKKVPGRLLTTLRQLPFYRMGKALMPEFLLVPLRKALRKPVQGRPEWVPETQAWVVDLLREDTETFLARYGKPRDFWTL